MAVAVTAMFLLTLAIGVFSTETALTRHALLQPAPTAWA
jgi:hypothetical protein